MLSESATGPSDVTAPPMVSVIIAAFDAAPFIERAIRSVQAQTLPDIEIIVVDDVSRDDTVAVVTELATRDSRIKLVRSPKNGGPSAARNLGIAAARGRWVAILDADDAFQPDRLEGLVRAAEEHSLDMIADNVIYYDATAQAEAGHGNLELGKSFEFIDMKRFLNASLFRRPLTDLSGRGYLQYALLKFVFRRAFLVEQGLRYPETIRDSEDFYFYASCLARGANAGLVADAGYLYTQRVGSLSGKASGQTRTVVDRSQVVRGVEALLAEHARAFDVVEVRLLRQRQEQARGLQAYETALAHNRSRDRRKALQVLASAPPSWGFLLQGIVQRVRRGRQGARP